jgi:hypothetical protein
VIVSTDGPAGVRGRADGIRTRRAIGLQEPGDNAARLEQLSPNETSPAVSLITKLC